MDLIVASNNKGKIVEYKNILEPLGYNVMSQSEAGVNVEVDETGTTFEENAYLKAKVIYDIKKTCVISDDSGLMVHALNDEPGIYSARYKGIDSESGRRKEILRLLENESDRSATFVCCICYIDETGSEHLFKGLWNGTIALKEEGTEGFGYDPIFISEDADKTTAVMGVNFKNKYSHRAKATKMLLDYLKK